MGFGLGLFVAIGICGPFLCGVFVLCTSLLGFSAPRCWTKDSIFVSCEYQSGGSNSSGSRELLTGEIWLEAWRLLQSFFDARIDRADASDEIRG